MNYLIVEKKVSNYKRVLHLAGKWILHCKAAPCTLKCTCVKIICAIDNKTRNVKRETPKDVEQIKIHN